MKQIGKHTGCAVYLIVGVGTLLVVGVQLWAVLTA